MKRLLIMTALLSLLMLPSSAWAVPCTAMNPADSTCSVRCDAYSSASKDCERRTSWISSKLQQF